MSLFLILVFFTILWLIFWSFTNALVRRIHEWKKISEWRSECPKCKNKLWFWDLIPLFSWVFLRWKCRYCKEEIWIRYPIVELFFWFFFFIITYFLFPENFLEIFTNIFLNWWNFFDNLKNFFSSSENFSRILNFFLILFLTWNFLILAIYDILYLEIIDWLAIWLWFWFLFLSIFDLWIWNFPNFKDWLIWFLIIYTFFYLQILIPWILFFIKWKFLDIKNNEENFFNFKQKIFWIWKIFSSYFIFPIWMFFRLFFSEKFLEKFKIFSDEQEKIIWKNWEEIKNLEIPAWIWWWDLRFALVMWFVLWWQKSILALFISYLIWWIYSIIFLIFEKINLKINKNSKNFSHEIPFLPFLTIWTFIVLIFWDKILKFYFENFLYL